MSRVKIAFLLLAAAGGCAGIVAAISANPASAIETPADARTTTLDDLAVKLTERFVDPDVAQRYAAMLRANAASGKYAAITDDEEFAKQVTADLQAVAFDGHLKLSVQPKGQAGGLPATSPAAKSKTVEATARLAGDIAYIRFGNFFGTDEGVAAAGKFMADNQDAKTIIFDLRTNNGGGLAEMDVVFPYLFDREIALLAMDTRSGVDTPIEDGPRLRQIDGPPSVVRREHFVVPAEGPRPLAKAKVFVLTSGHTASAGEHFVLALRRTHRATVIGETTNGAGNFGGFASIAGGFSAFIPVGRTLDPDSGKGWDYVGLAPDVEVPQQAALTEALVRSGVPKGEAERLAAQYQPPAEAIYRKRKAPPSVAGI